MKVTVLQLGVQQLLEYYNKGVIKDPHDLQEALVHVELRRKFRADDKDERKKIIERFENGQL